MTEPITLETAIQRIEQQIQPLQDYEQVTLYKALHQILAQDIHSPVNIPPHTNSAMDGYALHSRELTPTAKTRLTVIGTSYAGKPYTESVPAGHCVRIFTGAFLPPDTDTVVMQEQVTVENNAITFTSDQHSGQHVRITGEDVKRGQLILKAGQRLSPADLGLLAALGITTVTVTRPLRVALFSTGDELCEPGKIPQFGQIYDSNRYTIYGMLTQLGIKVTEKGIVPDNPQAIEDALLAVTDYDAIMTSGGVSVGSVDFVTDVLRRIGEIKIWKIAMKPGRPLLFGKIRETPIFGLPGNPVSVMVTFHQIVKPALQRLRGQRKITPLRIKVPCITPLKKLPGRLEFQRGILETNAQGQIGVRSTGQQGSGILSSMSQANCFIILPTESGDIPVGREVTVEPFTHL